MITITIKAIDQINKIRKHENILEHEKLRIYVKGGGCSGFTYQLAFDEKKEEDMVFTQHEMQFLVDRKSMLYLMGVELDFSDGLNGTGFTYNNPNATRACGCGASFGV